MTGDEVCDARTPWASGAAPRAGLRNKETCSSACPDSACPFAGWKHRPLFWLLLVRWWAFLLDTLLVICGTVLYNCILCAECSLYSSLFGL